MATYYVDDGGDGTTGASWATAYTSLSALDDAVTLASGDIVYIGHDHVCQYVHSANRIITGPTSGAPTVIISVTQGSSPPTYQASSTNQVDTTEGAYSLTFDGSFALYGLCIKTGTNCKLDADTNETAFAYGCTFKPASGFYIGGSQGVGTKCNYVNCTVDCTADAANRTGGVVKDSAGGSFINLTASNLGNRTGPFFDGIYYGCYNVSGLDMSSGSSSMSIINPLAAATGLLSITNVKTQATWTPWGATAAGPGTRIMLTNVGSADAPTYMAYMDYCGNLLSSASIYRTGGATVEGDATAWLVTTTANCNEHDYFCTPYIYGLISSTGSKTFTVYITNDTADLTDAEVWLEVEYLGTLDVAKWTLATDKRATITTTAAVQTDDTSSTWNGTGPSFTYKQSLAVTATVNETGQYRARVCVGKASIASSSYFYIDPKVTVS